MLEVKVTQTIPEQRIKDVLINGYEHGIDYWINVDKEGYHQFKTNRVELGLKCSFEEVPFHEGGKIYIQEDDRDQSWYTLDRESIEKGLQLMADSKGYRHHLQDIINENDDATTADVFYQFCTLGEVVYG